jgi:hypothetical protein
MALVVGAVVAGAVAASGDVEVIPAALLVGALLVGLHLAVQRILNPLLPAPKVPDDATANERARLMRPYERSPWLSRSEVRPRSGRCICRCLSSSYSC